MQLLLMGDADSISARIEAREERLRELDLVRAVLRRVGKFNPFHSRGGR